MKKLKLKSNQFVLKNSVAKEKKMKTFIIKIIEQKQHNIPII